MKIIYTIPFLLCSTVCDAQQAGFTTPDTICVNTPITVNNTSAGGAKFYWSFCGINPFSVPQVTNSGLMNNIFSIPVFSETVKEGNNYYTFIVNNGSGGLIRLSYGNSLSNTPVVKDFGDFGGVIHGTAEGLQVIKDAVGWRVIVVGGNDPINPANIYIVKIDFGNSLDNMSPTPTYWGNIGSLSYPTDLYIFRENNVYYGFTANAQSNTVTRFTFGADFNNPPTGTNLGNLGSLNWPTGVYAIKIAGEWYVFICNANSNSITRLYFGTSLLNTPIAVNLGNPGNLLNHPRDLLIINDCGTLTGLVANGSGNDILKLAFDGNSITGALTATSYGNIGNLGYPHSISSLIREGDDLYTIVTNAFNGTFTRLKFEGCTNGSIPSSLQQQPPVFTYTTAGTYNIKMMMDEGLATQQSVCKDVVVMPALTADVGPDIKVCDGATVTLDAGADNDTKYVWSSGSTTQQLPVNTTGHYMVTKSNGGCTASDDINVSISTSMQLAATNAAYTCGDLTGQLDAVVTGGTGPYEYFLNTQDVGATPAFDQLSPGTYTIDVKDAVGCTASTQVTINLDAVVPVKGTLVSTPPSCLGKEDGVITLSTQQGAQPIEYAIKGAPFQPSSVFTDIGPGTYTLYARNAACIDSFEVTLTAEGVTLNTAAKDATCDLADGKLDVTASGGTPPYTFYNKGQVITQMDQLLPGDYEITAIDSKGCSSTADLTTINNIYIPRISILNKDATINVGQTIQLQAVNGVDYEWTPANGLSCNNCATPVAQPLEPTTYIVKTLTGNNCITSDTIHIAISHYQYLYVPGAFTPNHDGTNDYFKVKSYGLDRFRMSIYNRWGELIYVSNNPENGWDGSFKNVLQSSGTYVYMIEYAYFDKQPLLQKGVLTLVK